MKIILNRLGGEKPFTGEPPRPGDKASQVQARGAFPTDFFGAFSLQTFANQPSLSHTHADAQGWLDYLGQFHPSNFWYKDANVRIWAYTEPYDDWQDTYGLDAVLAVYHSGHGGMGSDGKFFAPLGSDWGGLGTNAYSNAMNLAADHANYIFWSTCTSCRVHGGLSPISTWATANKGFRMLFGFETTSVDSPSYGSNFWEEWNGHGKSLSTAWLDASWDIDHHQAPSVVACGTTADEAKNRVFNERFFDWAHVSTNWWWWRWYESAAATSAVRSPELTFPKAYLIAELKSQVADEAFVRAVLGRLHLELKLPDQVVASRGGRFHLAGPNDTLLGFGQNGLFEAQLARANLSNLKPIAVERARQLADAAVTHYGLGKAGSDLAYHTVRHATDGGGSPKGSGKLEGPYVSETTLQYRQIINGLPVVTPNAGLVRVSVDNDGVITRVQASTRAVAHLSDRPKNTTATPNEPGPIGVPTATDAAGVGKLLEAEWDRQRRTWTGTGHDRARAIEIPGTTEIGYDVRGDQAVLVAKRLMEVDFGGGIKKRYHVIVPLFE